MDRARIISWSIGFLLLVSYYFRPQPIVGTKPSRLMTSQERVLPCSCLGSVYHQSVPSEVLAALESLLSGPFIPDQIVIVVDGPVGELLQDQLKRFNELCHPLDIVLLSHNQGRGAALHAGLLRCRHDIVLRYDTDDINDPSRPLLCFTALESDPSLDILGSWVAEFSPYSSILSSKCVKRVPLSPADISRCMEFRNPLNHPSVAFRKSSILAIGSYENVPFFEDYYLWLKARKAGLRIANLPLVLVHMRRSSALGRRSGFSYLISELYFFRQATGAGLVAPYFVFPAFLRILSRLLPSRLQSFQDILPWRRRSTVCMHPDLVHKIAHGRGVTLPSSL